MKKRRDGKKNVSRAYASVSINEVDHPNLYAAVKLGKIEKQFFSSASSFLATAGEEKLQLILEEKNETDVDVTNAELLEMLKRLMDKIDQLESVGIKKDDDDFDDIRDLLNFT